MFEFYLFPLNLGSIEYLGLKPVNDTFNKLGLPQNPPTDEEAEKLDIPKIVGLAQRHYGKDIFLEIGIHQDWRNSTKNRLMASNESKKLVWKIKKKRSSISVRIY